MMVDTGAPSAVAERVRELCRQFKLPTLAAETVGRFSEAGHADALVTLVEVMEQEAEDRRVRRVDRLRRASKLPAGKTWDTFEHDRTSVQLRQQLNRLGEGDFADRGVNVLAFGMSRVPGSGVRGRGSGERETTASSLAGKQQAREKEDNGGQGRDGPAGAIAQGGNGR